MNIMKQWVFSLVCLFAAVIGVPAAGNVQAQQAPGVQLQLPPEQILQQPLVIVRFNQRNVYFQRQLYNALSKAMEIDPTVSFDILTLAPMKGERNRDAKLYEQAMMESQEVVDAMLQMGVPKMRINRVFHNSRTADTTEVHIFVR